MEVIYIVIILKLCHEFDMPEHLMGRPTLQPILINGLWPYNIGVREGWHI